MPQYLRVPDDQHHRISAARVTQAVNSVHVAIRGASQARQGRRPTESGLAVRNFLGVLKGEPLADPAVGVRLVGFDHRQIDEVLDRGGAASLVSCRRCVSHQNVDIAAVVRSLEALREG